MSIELTVRIAKRDSANPDLRVTAESSLSEVQCSDAENMVVQLLRRCMKSKAGGDQSQSTANPSASKANGRLATEKQVRAIEVMAKQQGFDLRRFLADEAGASTVKALSIREASDLIGRLKHQQDQ